MTTDKSASLAQHSASSAASPASAVSTASSASTGTATSGNPPSDRLSAGNQQYPDGRKYYIFLVAYLVLLSAFGSFVNDMYLPTLPEMRRYFHCPVPTVQLGLTTGMIGLAVGQLFLGPLSDRYGRKSVLMISMGVFIIGAIASVFSPTIHVFLLCRLVQGIGASGGYFLARTVPADIYGGRPLAKMMALIGAINGFAPASAPVLGGLLARDIHWQGIFLVLAGVAALLILSGIFFHESLPANRRESGPLRDMFREYGPLLRNKAFMTHVMLKGAALGLLFAYTSSAPFIMQEVYGFSELKFGLFMGFNSLFAAAGATFALRFKVLKRAAWTGGWVMMLATAVESLALFFVHDFWAYEASLLPMIFSMGMIFTAGNTLAMNEGRTNAGAASAILGVGGYVFGAIVSPLVGLGDMLHSTAIVFLVMGAVTLLCSYGSRLLPADLDRN